MLRELDHKKDNEKDKNARKRNLAENLLFSKFQPEKPLRKTSTSVKKLNIEKIQKHSKYFLNHR